MPTIHINIQGLDETLKRLDDIGGVRMLEPAMWKAVSRLADYMSEYPPVRSGSTYVRTGTLGRRWAAATSQSVTVAGNTIRGAVGNNTAYAPLVQSSRFQARVHRGRWRTDVMAINANRDKIVADFIAALRAALR